MRREYEISSRLLISEILRELVVGMTNSPDGLFLGLHPEGGVFLLTPGQIVAGGVSRTANKTPPIRVKHRKVSTALRREFLKKKQGLR